MDTNNGMAGANYGSICIPANGLKQQERPFRAAPVFLPRSTFNVSRFTIHD
jgi:hypothetical protein